MGQDVQTIFSEMLNELNMTYEENVKAMKTTIAPVVCLRLALDSWNYCSGEQGLTAQHISATFFIQLNNVNK